jgi:TonB family protein
MKLFLVSITLLIPLLSVSQSLKSIEIFYPGGNIKETYTVLDSFTKVKHGEYLLKYENGNVKEMGKYSMDKKTSEWKTYYSNSKLRSIGEYGDGKRIGIWNFYNKEEKLIEIFDANTWKKKRDVNYLLSLGGNYIGYPAIAKEEGKEGIVEISFHVDTNCNCLNFEVVSSSDPIFTQEAIRAVKKTTSKWIRYIDVYCQDTIVQLPVNFNLQ